LALLESPYDNILALSLANRLYLYDFVTFIKLFNFPLKLLPTTDEAFVRLLVGLLMVEFYLNGF